MIGDEGITYFRNVGNVLPNVNVAISQKKIVTSTAVSSGVTNRPIDLKAVFLPAILYIQKTLPNPDRNMTKKF
jgi:hypothetical protein